MVNPPIAVDGEVKRLLCVDDWPLLLDLNSDDMSGLLAAEKPARREAPCNGSPSLSSQEHRSISNHSEYGSSRPYLQGENDLPSRERPRPGVVATSTLQHGTYMANS